LWRQYVSGMGKQRGLQGEEQQRRSRQFHGVISGFLLFCPRMSGCAASITLLIV
jgi:hypothetical protein